MEWTEFLDIEEIEKAVNETITPATVGEYNTTPSDWKLGLYYAAGRGFSAVFGESVGLEIAEEERAVATISCPGIGNIDPSYFWQDFAEPLEDGQYKIIETGELVSESEMIEKSCLTGDVEDFRVELVQKLVSDLYENL